jgi:hypothetical protein
VSFIQNIIRIIDMLPNLPSGLDVIVLQPSDYVENKTRYLHSFQSHFQVRKDYIITWLQFLKANHSGYQNITISPDWMQFLLVDNDIFSSFVTIIDETRDPPRQ